VPPAYHATPSRPPRPHSVKAAPHYDVRDQWRRQVAADPAVGARGLRVALALENYARGRDGRTTVGVARLVDDIGMDSRNVRRGLAELVKLGHVRRVAGRGQKGNGGTTAETWLTLKAGPVDKNAAAVDKVGATVAPTGFLTRGANGSKVGATVAPQTPLSENPKSARAPASQGERAAPRQGELPILADVRHATPEHVAESLKRIRARLRK